MIITIELPAEIEADLRAESAERGRSIEELLAEAVSERYARTRRESKAVVQGPFHSLAEAGGRRRSKLGLEDFSHLSPEELEARANSVLTSIPPEKIADAERLGLL